MQPVRVAPVVLPRSLLVTLPEVSTSWPIPGFSPGFSVCCCRHFFGGKVGGKHLEMIYKQKKARQGKNLYIDGLLIEDVYIYHEPPKPLKK